MPYATWTEVVAVVEGPQRMRSLLAGHAEDLAADFDDDSAVRPFFDQQSAVAQRMVDAQLERAGYETPLDTPLTDRALFNAYVGILIGLLVQTYSDQEAWMEKFAKAGWEYVKAIGDGSSSIVGGEVDDTPDTGRSDLVFDEVAVFDGADSQSTLIYSNLGPGPSRWR